MTRILVSWVSVIAIVACSGAMGRTSAFAADAGNGGASAKTEQAYAAFGLKAGTVMSLDVTTEPGRAQRVIVPVGDKLFVLDVEPHSVRANNYEVRYQAADGTYVTVEPAPVRTVRGTVAGVDGAVVAGSVQEDGLLAVIILPEDERIWIEPLASRVAGAAPGDHIVYRDGDVIPTGGSCATEADALANDPTTQPTEAGVGCSGDICVAELACDSDVEYFQRWGSNVESRINSVTNIMNAQYEGDVGITHIITHIIVRPTEPDPYNSFANHTLLTEFRNHWLANQQDVIRDVAELFTGRNITGGVIGEAWTIGGICTTSGYCFVESDCCGSISCSTDLSAHELGHLWSGFHCTCFSWTMNPSLTCANRFNPNLTIPDILFHRDTRSCLSDVTPTTVFPFEDAFENPDLDMGRWLNEGATVDEFGANEPSAPFSLHLAGDGRAATGFMNTAGAGQLAIAYWWQRSGNFGPGGSPESGEDLVMDYRSAGGDWVEAGRHAGDPGDGGDQEPYERNCVLLDGDALHSAFQIRFRLIDAEPGDNFFVDDVSITEAGPGGCALQTTPPEIVHASGLPGETRPFSGYIDPRRESSDGTSPDLGVSEFAILFSEPVESVGGGPLTAASFMVTNTGGATPPAVLSVNADAMPLVVVTLDRPITLQEYTTIQAVVRDFDDPPNQIVDGGNLGAGVNEVDRVDVAFLPADVDQSGNVTPFDLLAFRQIVNDVTNPEAGIEADYVDADRDGEIAPFDLLAFRQLINGVPPATRAWAEQSVNNPRP